MNYELIYIIDTVVAEEERKAIIERFSELIKQNNGEVTKVDEWGKRRLAYAINDKMEGYYVLVNFSADSLLPKELERNLEINEQVMRYLITRVEEKQSRVKPRSQQARSFQHKAEEEKVEEPVVAEEQE